MHRHKPAYEMYIHLPDSNTKPPPMFDCRNMFSSVRNSLSKSNLRMRKFAHKLNDLNKQLGHVEATGKRFGVNITASQKFVF